jgi:hypothetical protein
MKKIFLFAAAVVAAMSVNASVWEFSKDSINSVDAVKAMSEATSFVLNQKESSDKAPYVAVDYKTPDEEAELYFTDAPIEVSFSYKNSGEKTEVLKFYKSYLQICRKGVVMTIYCLPGDVITLTPKSYGKACEFTVTGADKNVVAFEKDSEAAVTLTATDTEVVFDSSKPSSSDYAQACQFVSIQVDSDSAQGVEDVNTTVMAKKVVRNGQVLIERNGVAYTVLGSIAE